MRILPAYDTKHEPSLEYQIALPKPNTLTPLCLKLAQDDTAGASTGTTLWLGGQVLAAYLLHMKPPKSARDASMKTAIDLGSGIGLTALALAACGYRTLATDIPLIVDDVLCKNLEANSASIASLTGSGSVDYAALDWTSEYADYKAILPEHIDVITTSDSIYVEHLVEPLLSTIRTLCIHSQRNTTQQAAPVIRATEVYLAYEHRDDAQYKSFVAKAQALGFAIQALPNLKLAKAVQAAYNWQDRKIWEGISVIKMQLV